MDCGLVFNKDKKITELGNICLVLMAIQGGLCFTFLVTSIETAGFGLTRQGRITFAMCVIGSAFSICAFCLGIVGTIIKCPKRLIASVVFNFLGALFYFLFIINKYMIWSYFIPMTIDIWIGSLLSCHLCFIGTIGQGLVTNPFIMPYNMHYNIPNNAQYNMPNNIQNSIPNNLPNNTQYNMQNNNFPNNNINNINLEQRKDIQNSESTDKLLDNNGLNNTYNI